jgi:type III pantothenate kinase
MKLVIDVGNTNIKFALFKNHIIKQSKIIPTKQYKQIPNFKNVDMCVLGSVVPTINQKIVNDIYKKYHIQTKVINAKDFNKHFDLSRFNQNEIGLDILAFALAIKSKYLKGIGISFGTATFAICVDKNIIHGVAIAPSFDEGLQSIFHKTALIKNTKISSINFKLGSNTAQSLSSGVAHSVNGFVNSVMVHCQQNYHISNVFVDGGKSG